MKTQLFGKVLAVAGALAAIVAVSVSIHLNPPSAVKGHAQDDERLQGLQQIDFAVKAYYRSHQALPDRLDAMENENGLTSRTNWKDPVTHQLYEYDATGKTTYQLCADFAADSEKDENSYMRAFRNHHKGHDCFQQDVSAN